VVRVAAGAALTGYGSRPEARKIACGAANGTVRAGGRSLPLQQAVKGKRFVSGVIYIGSPCRHNVRRVQQGGDGHAAMKRFRRPASTSGARSLPPAATSTPPANDQAAGLDPADFEVIGEKVSYRLARRPGSYVILKYVRPVIKLRAAQVLSCPPAPAGVLGGWRADVSFIAGMIIDKFAYHQPSYRQHVKLQDSGLLKANPCLQKLIKVVENFYMLLENMVPARPSY
jgi:hypothetical protein